MMAWVTGALNHRLSIRELILGSLYHAVEDESMEMNEVMILYDLEYHMA